MLTVLSWYAIIAILFLAVILFLSRNRKKKHRQMVRAFRNSYNEICRHIEREGILIKITGIQNADMVDLVSHIDICKDLFFELRGMADRHTGGLYLSVSYPNNSITEIIRPCVKEKFGLPRWFSIEDLVRWDLNIAEEICHLIRSIDYIWHQALVHEKTAKACQEDMRYLQNAIDNIIEPFKTKSPLL